MGLFIIAFGQVLARTSLNTVMCVSKACSPITSMYCKACFILKADCYSDTLSSSSVTIMYTVHTYVYTGKFMSCFSIAQKLKLVRE